MSFDEIRELLQLFNESGVGELEVQRGEDRVRIRKALPEVAVQAIAAPPTVIPVAAPAPVHSAPSAPVETPPPSPATAASQTAEVIQKSPMIGTFYTSPSPEAPPFVKVGDSVKPGQVLCVIEAMKLFNEIEAEVAGTVVSQFVENGNPVEYNQPLYAIRPH